MRILLILLLLLSPSLLAIQKKEDLRKGIRSTADWIERYEETRDPRIFYILAARAGRVVDMAKAKEVTEYIAKVPERQEEIFRQWGILVDVEAFNAKAYEEWEGKFGKDAKTLKTKYYEVFYTKKDSAMAKVLASYMNKVFVFYRKKFKMDEPIDGRFLVKLYPNHASFLESGAPGFAFAYFSASQRSLVGYAKDFKSKSDEKSYLLRLIKTFFHEGFHQFLAYYVPNPPAWLNEGLAENFEAVQITKGRVAENRNINNNDLLWLQKFIKEKKTTPLKRLIFMSQKEMYQNTEVHYPMSWGLIHFFAYGSRSYKKYFQDVIAELKNGADRQEALEKVFAKVDWEKFEKAWKSYILKLKKESKRSQL